MLRNTSPMWIFVECMHIQHLHAFLKLQFNLRNVKSPMFIQVMEHRKIHRIINEGGLGIMLSKQLL